MARYLRLTMIRNICIEVSRIPVTNSIQPVTFATPCLTPSGYPCQTHARRPGVPVSKCTGRRVAAARLILFRARGVVGAGDFSVRSLWLMGRNYPLVNCRSLLLKMAIEIVDFPIKDGDFQ